MHQLAAATRVREAGKVASDDHANAETMRFTDFRQPDAGREAVHVKDVGALVCEPAIEPFGAADGNTVVRLLPDRRVESYRNTGT